MPAPTIITLRLRPIVGADGESRIELIWFLPEGEGQYFADSLEGAMKHVGFIIRGAMESTDIDMEMIG